MTNQQPSLKDQIRTHNAGNQPPPETLIKQLIGKRILVSFTNDPTRAFEHKLEAVGIGHVKLDDEWRSVAHMRILEEIPITQQDDEQINMTVGQFKAFKTEHLNLAHAYRTLTEKYELLKEHLRKLAE